MDGTGQHSNLPVSPAGICCKYSGRKVGCAWEVGGGVRLGKRNCNLLIIVAASDGITHSYSLLYFYVGLKKRREIALMGRIAVLVG